MEAWCTLAGSGLAGSAWGCGDAPLAPAVPGVPTQAHDASSGFPSTIRVLWSHSIFSLALCCFSPCAFHAFEGGQICQGFNNQVLVLYAADGSKYMEYGLALPRHTLNWLVCRCTCIQWEGAVKMLRCAVVRHSGTRNSGPTTIYFPIAKGNA